MASAASAQQSPCGTGLARRLLALIEQETGVQLGDHDAWLNKARAALTAAGEALPPAQPQPAKLPCTLQFAHSCRYTACTEQGCQLCRNNPHKACRVQLRPKYVVGQEVGAPCGAALRITFAPQSLAQVPSGGGSLTAAVGGSSAGGPGSPEAQQQWAALRGAGTRMQLLLVDERMRQQRAKQLLLTGASSASNQQVAALLRETTVAFDPAGKPMLTCESGSLESDGSLVLELGEDASAGVPIAGLTVGCSTERATSGRKRAPVRLAALFVDANGQPLDVPPSLSTEFYVVSDRAENHEGQPWLLLDSPVSAVRTIGKETVRRLADLPAACKSCGTELEIPNGLTTITTVRQLGQLLRQLKNQSAALSQVLKISKAQLEAAANHVATAVEPDSFLRAFLAPAGDALVFTCQQGGCDYAEPAAIMRYERKANGEVEALALQQLSVDEFTEEMASGGPLRELWTQAEAAWAAPKHDGWVVLQLRGKRFESFQELENCLPAGVCKPVLPQLREAYEARQQQAAPQAAHLALQQQLLQQQPMLQQPVQQQQMLQQPVQQQQMLQQAAQIQGMQQLVQQPALSQQPAVSQQAAVSQQPALSQQAAVSQQPALSQQQLQLPALLQRGASVSQQAGSQQPAMSQQAQQAASQLQQAASQLQAISQQYQAASQLQAMSQQYQAASQLQALSQQQQAASQLQVLHAASLQQQQVQQQAQQQAVEHLVQHMQQQMQQQQVQQQISSAAAATSQAPFMPELSQVLAQSLSQAAGAASALANQLGGATSAQVQQAQHVESAPSEEVQALQHFAAQICNNPFALAAAAAAAMPPAPGASAAAPAAPAAAAEGGSGLKRQHSCCSAGEAPQPRAVRPRVSQDGAATPVERPSLDSNSFSHHASQGSQAPHPTHPTHKQQQQQTTTHRLMPSVPRAPFESRTQQDQQQADLLELLCRLSQQQANGSSLFSLGSLGITSAASLRLMQRLTDAAGAAAAAAGNGAAAGGNGTAAAGVDPSATVAALQSLPLEFWTPSLEQLAQLFTEDHSIPLVPLPLPGNYT